MKISKKSNGATHLKAFRQIIWPRRRILMFGVLLITIGRLASMVLPWKSKYLLDEVIPRKDYAQLGNVLFIVIVSISIQAVTSFFVTRLLGIEAEYLIKDLRIKVQKKILSLPVRFFDNSKSGALVSRIMNDVEGIRNLIGEGLVQLIGGSITAIVCLFLLLNVNIFLTIIVLIPMTVFAFVVIKAFQYLHPIFVRKSELNSNITGRLSEMLVGIRVIKAYNAESAENKIFELGISKLLSNSKKGLTADAIIMSASTLLLGLASILVLGLGSYYVMQGKISAGDFLLFAFLLALMILPIIQIGNIGSQLTMAMAGIDRTEELLNLDPEEDEKVRTIKLGSITGDIIFENVSFSYNPGIEVLHNISFSALSGTVTALVGSSGSGKSTIASLAASFLSPDSGKVTVDGYDISNIKLDSYRKELGIVLQDEFLFDGTIRENILFANPNATSEQLQNAVIVSNVIEFSQRFEKGLDTMIGERGIKLSGGQRQRIALARVILADSQIMILDEATSSLDTESEMLIQDSLSKLLVGRTTIIIAHRLSTIERADQILVIESGEIVERGTHKELLSRSGRYCELYKFQVRI
jgi:ABC-type multidrug transport system fused ATPase/permease subunit